MYISINKTQTIKRKPTWWIKKQVINIREMLTLRKLFQVNIGFCQYVLIK